MSDSIPGTTDVPDGLTLLRDSDRARFVAAVEAGRQRGWGYFLPYLLSLNRPGKSAVFIGAESGSLSLFRWRRAAGRTRMDLCFPPIPMNSSCLDRAIERVNAFNGDRSARILRIDEHDAAALSDRPDLQLKPRRRQYLFAPSSYEDLGGRKLRTLRRHVAAIDALPGIRTATMTSQHIDGCRELLRKWSMQHRRRHGTAGGVVTSRLVLDSMVGAESAHLRSQVVLHENRVVAFCLGGPIRDGLACFLEAKCDPAIRGLSYYQRYRFLLHLREFAEVNDGSDAGRAGLRQIKESFRPVDMHVEYRAHQRG